MRIINAINYAKHMSLKTQRVSYEKLRDVTYVPTEKSLISALSIIMGFMAGVSFATVSLDKPIAKSVYSISRNPMYFLGLLTVCGGTDSLVSIGVAQSEEPSLIEKYGDAY